MVQFCTTQYSMLTTSIKVYQTRPTDKHAPLEYTHTYYTPYLTNKDSMTSQKHKLVHYVAQAHPRTLLDSQE